MSNQNKPIYGGMKQVLAVSLGLFLVFLDSTVVNISLPNIMNDYEINLSVASWIINSFVLTLAILLITLGKIADFFWQKKNLFNWRYYICHKLIIMWNGPYCRSFNCC